jgi:hypothetical protein
MPETPTPKRPRGKPPGWRKYPIPKLKVGYSFLPETARIIKEQGGSRFIERLVTAWCLTRESDNKIL